MEVLEALAATSPTDYLQRALGGDSTLRQLYAKAAKAGLVPHSASDDIFRLHSLFDVALDHGLGGLVRDYVVQVCSDRRRTSSDPLEAFLLDGECVRRWVVKLLAVGRGRLASWLARGLGSAGSAGVVLAKELGHLQMLQLVAEALSPSGAAGEAASTAELAEAARLVQCARVLTWLSQQRLAFDRSTGRYFSEQEWRSVAARRREGATASGGTFFLADMCTKLAQHGIDATLAYPPTSTDRLLSALFLPHGSGGGRGAGSGGGCCGEGEGALHAKLALLAYYLADGGFMAPDAIVTGLQTLFGVPPSTASSWLLQQHLDDAQTADAGGAVAMQRAAELAPAVDGAQLPHSMLQVFASRGQPAVALALLRQRPESSASLGEAVVALCVRFQSGLLTEAFLGVKRHLAAVAAAAPNPAAAAAARRTHAAVLVGQLLQYAAGVSGAGCGTSVHAVARLPFDGVEEEATLAWLEDSTAAGQAEAALMLPLYFLMRGRTPEALHAHARCCPRTPASHQQAELAALLAEAAWLLPAQQRSLVVQRGAIPALLPLGSAGEAEAEGGLTLMGSIPATGVDVVPTMLVVGPTPAQAPLVGSVPALLEQRRMAVAAGGGGAQAGTALQSHGAPLSLFRQQQAAGTGVGAGTASTAGFGAAAAEEGGTAEAAAAFGSTPGGTAAPQLAGTAHEFDRVLGLGAAAAAPGSRGKRRRWGGSAYR